MTKTAIKIDHLSKLYRLGAGPQGRGDFREAAAASVSRIARGLRLTQKPQRSDADVRELWALRDVSFEVKEGEVVGLIGHNGAGKSTLLKILSRITDPTSGEAWFDGRIGSLLEVGTGFHPELSGRENIYLNGAILGMKRREIDANFDQIVEFSGISRFLDTPVKRYSSGMYVRLAFSVAAHLEPEILVIDEVLAVGDAAFQRKCLAKMRDVASDGRTILFVSHNMGSVTTLCDRAIVLSNGQVLGEGAPLDAVKIYLDAAREQQSEDLGSRTDRSTRGNAKVIDITIHSEGHSDTPGLLIHGRRAYLVFTVDNVLPNMNLNFSIRSALDDTICRFSSRAQGPGDASSDGDTFVCEIPDLSLVPGSYRLNVGLFSGSTREDWVTNAIEFNVERGAMDGRSLAHGQEKGIFVPRHYWKVPKAGAGANSNRIAV